MSDQSSLHRPQFTRPEPRPQRVRRTTVRDWIPDQPGAWVMALAPALAGAVCGSAWSATKPDAVPSAAGWWVLVCWALCYCVEFTAARWLKSHCATRYLLPALGYCIALAAAGLPFLILHVDVLVWAPIYMVLAAVAFAGAWFRRERSLWANAAAVIAASLMATITLHYAANSPSLPQVSLPGLVLALCFAATQFGSVLFVKTMIRERGKRLYVAASWIWHIALLSWWIAAADHSWYLVALGVILLVRAIALPLIACKRTVKPVVVGITECFTSLITFGCIIANVLIAL
ncbi:YwiC-like family protein [Bifidobacterium felsineum]|uniref:YwiC-like family protein n=1 Tax=Bifidobacterium felsineum TaxID=2045440 RepID=UPI001BDD7604|nr:YwiC-like family protein [Bifidobacterium felsineum]MBT1163463.1 YwiC-like family protein [Bifidobacterium felsineum]